MLTEKQLAANQANAQLATGPSTPEGKQRSSQNSHRHGITGKLIFASSQEREAHHEFCDRIIASLRPEGDLEAQYAQSVAEDHWRITRVRTAESSIFAKADSGEIFLTHAKELALLTLYEQRINRAIERNLATLQALQAERKAADKAAMEEAKLLAQLSLSNGHAFNPSENGFVFSSAEINRRIDRDNRLNEAKALASNVVPMQKMRAKAA